MVHKPFAYAPCIRTSQPLNLLDTCNNPSLLSSYPTIKLHLLLSPKHRPATPSPASKTIQARWPVVHHCAGVSKQLRIQFFFSYLDILFHVDYRSGLSFSKQSFTSSRSNKQRDEKETLRFMYSSLWGPFSQFCSELASFRYVLLRI